MLSVSIFDECRQDLESKEAESLLRLRPENMRPSVSWTGSRGRHRAACPLAGVWGAEDFLWRTQPFGSAGRHNTPSSPGYGPLLLRQVDNRRLEVVVDGGR